VADDGTDSGGTGDEDDSDETGDGAAGSEDEQPRTGPEMLREHVEAVITAQSGEVRVLDSDFQTLDERPSAAAFDAVLEASDPPFAVVVDGEATQRLVDVAAQRGVEHVVARSTGEFVKQPVDVRVRTAAQLATH
jgi:hypothetical protein